MKGKLVRALALALIAAAVAAVGVAAAFASASGGGHNHDGATAAQSTTTRSTGTTTTGATTTTTTTTTTKSDDDSNKDDKGGGQNGSGKDDDDNKDGKGNGNRNEHAFCFDDICSTWDAQWLKMSIEGDRYEIAAGTLGLQKSSNPAVRTLAQTLVTDHTQSLQDAIDLAQKFHIDVPPEPSPVQQWILGDLAQHTGSQFDVEFSSVEVKDHQEDIDQAQTEVKCGVVPAIRSDADDELPMLHKHLELAQAALAASGGTH
jgi:putative membrane protein